MSRDEAAARLIERVLTDAEFRARFRADPEAAAHEAGVAPARDAVLETLELRESKSSLAGAMMAAAAEAVGVYELVDHYLASRDDGSGVAAQLASAQVPVRHDVAASLPAPQPEIDDAESDGPDEADDGPDEDDDGPDEDDDGPDQDDDDEPDEDEDEDADEPDEEEPDEEEPDEQGPDQDDLTDDEVVGGDDSSDDSDSSDDDDSSGSSDDDDSDSSDGDDSSDSSDDDAAPDLDGVDSDYPGDDASQDKLAAWMAAEAKRRGLPAELPVMAALVESGMNNLSGGDADSVGFFQMRVSIWDQGDYAGYGDRPQKQLDWFLDQAERARAQRIARGLSVKDPKQFGEWIADVERPAAQYRGRYQVRLEDARELIRKGAPLVDAIEVGAPHAGPQAKEALAEAMRYLGTPYQWGGSNPKTGFDCSGLVQWAYAKAGIRIPRVTDQQFVAEGATKVGRKDLLPGDLVFFRDSTGYIHHVGMSLGGDRFVNAPHTGDVVKVSSLKEPYWANEFAGGRRFDAAAAGEVAHHPRAHASATKTALEALDRDAADVNHADTALHLAIERQEANKRNDARVMLAITPDQIERS